MQALPPFDLADALNQGCACRTLDPQALRQQLHALLPHSPDHPDLEDTHAHLFSATTVFLSQAMGDAIAEHVAALERVMALPQWRSQALAHAGALAQHDPGPLGVLMGYDYHIGAQGPQLIEINTNAGGAWLNGVLARAQQACCETDASRAASPDPLEDALFAMFQAEWQRQRPGQPLRQVAIVDDAPEQQYLAPEFALAQRMFTQRGLPCQVLDAGALRWHGGRLVAPDGSVLDLVYNRLTDFALQDSAHAALAQAYAAGAVVLTPHPHAHAVHASKRHLATLGDAAALRALGVPEDDVRTVLRHTPPSLRVQADNADTLWQQRRRYFFKPLDGFGSRAVYRGDKLTRGVWAQIVAGGYIAQTLVPPGQRTLSLGEGLAELKYDLRAYAYAGQVLLLAARIYQGQTTNFRSAGGGFAPVRLLDLPGARPTGPVCAKSCAQALSG
ncbi:MAG: hypothetical protein ACT4NV_09145 [Rhodoferax sp.]